jgi:hypothetical protein
MGGKSSYIHCIFWENKLETGLKGLPRYDLAINAGATLVSNCFFSGVVHDLRGILGTNNMLKPLDPKFGDRYVPQEGRYEAAGYRPK